jgi:hypothetical protein
MPPDTPWNRAMGWIGLAAMFVLIYVWFFGFGWVAAGICAAVIVVTAGLTKEAKKPPPRTLDDKLGALAKTYAAREDPNWEQYEKEVADILSSKRHQGSWTEMAYNPGAHWNRELHETKK